MRSILGMYFLVASIFITPLILVGCGEAEDTKTSAQVSPELVRVWDKKCFGEEFKGIFATCPKCGHVIDRNTWELHWYANEDDDKDEPLNSWQKEKFARWVEKNPAALPLTRKAMEDGVILYSEMEQIESAVRDESELEQEETAEELLKNVLDGKPLPPPKEPQKIDPFAESN